MEDYYDEYYDDGYRCSDCLHAYYDETTCKWYCELDELVVDPDEPPCTYFK